MNTRDNEELGRTAANYVPLSPVSLLQRTAEVHPERTAIRYGARAISYRQFAARCRRLGAALVYAGIRRGEVISIIAANTPAHLEAHFGVAMAGAVLHSVNVRLNATEIGYQLDHARSRVLLVDPEFARTADGASAGLGSAPLRIAIEDPDVATPDAVGQPYEAFLASGDPEFVPLGPLDEWDAISLNYTSGTTGKPKGVVYHHRGAYLNAVGNVLAAGIGSHPVYLWTLPMFHCNGWCFPWTITALAGTHVCLRRPEPARVFEALRHEGITHFCAAPTVLTMLLAAKEAGGGLPARVRALTAGAAPPAAVIAACEALGIDITHLYGLTEVYGPCVVNEWKEEFQAQPPAERARLKARQGVAYHLQEGLAVMDPVTMTAVVRDGATMGEVMIRGNAVMKGYLHDARATAEAFRGGWFHSGDLAVQHPDGYIEIRDRSKDIVISGGENISSIEVEGVLFRHPAVLEAAVVARPHPKWGEVPCAFVMLRADMNVSAASLIAFCREHLAHFKAPRTIVFGELPKTATGKIMKFALRERARQLSDPIA